MFATFRRGTARRPTVLSGIVPFNPPNTNLPISQIKPVGRYYLDLAEILRKRMGNATNSATVVRIQEIG